jgi:hypothetical protein
VRHQSLVPSPRDHSLVGVYRQRLERMWATALLAVLVGVLPLAHANPVDPLWHGGIYDASDYDDVVQAITALDGSVEIKPLTSILASNLPVVDLTGAPAPPDPLVCCIQPRAPPRSVPHPIHTL